MTEKSMFWSAPTSGDGASGYTEAEVRRLFGFLTGTYLDAAEGVLLQGGQLVVSGSASPLSVTDGAAFVNGYFYWNTTGVNVVVPTPTIGTTGHRVVLQLINSSKTVRIALISSSDGVAAYPALTQTDGVQWEIPLANLTITTGGVITLVDARSFVHMQTRIGATQLDDGSVYQSKIVDAQVSEAKLTSAAAAKLVTNGSSHDHNGGDGAQIPTGGLADDAVDDTKAGNRVAQFYRRKGGNASQWGTAGDTDYIPGAIRVQFGTVLTTTPSIKTVTFPVAFSGTPVVILTVRTNNRVAYVSNLLSTSFGCATTDLAGSLATCDVSWMAIGPE